MKLDIIKVGNWQGFQYSVRSPDIEGFCVFHQHLPLALSNFGTLLEDYHQSLKSREPNLAPNLKQELELLEELFE